MSDLSYIKDHWQEIAVINKARNLGRDAGEAAGSWAADGSTDAEYALRTIQQLEDGDPEAWGYLPEIPNLSGEWADSPTPRSLADDLGIDPESDLLEAACEAWEEGVSETFEDACIRELRNVVTDEIASREAGLLGE